MSEAYKKSLDGYFWLGANKWQKWHYFGNTTEVDIVYRSSLLRRVRAAHSLYYDACDTMSLEQVNYVERHGVLPIAFSLVHQVLIEDSSLLYCGGPQAQFNAEWSAKMQLGVDDHGKSRSVDEMMGQRIGDYNAFRAIQRLVFDATERYVADVDPKSLDEIIITFPYPDAIASTFSARVGGEKGITRSDALECWVYQHALRHMGEIEHARALVGLAGMTS